MLCCLLEDPGVSNHKLARRMDISKRRISVARIEILRDFSFLEGEVEPVLEGKKPVYLRASQVC